MPSEKCLLHFPRWMIHCGDVVTDIVCEPVMILSALFCVRGIFSKLVSLTFVLQTGVA